MVRMLIILRHPILSIGKYPLPFLVPVILSVHIPLGACSKPVSLDAPVTHHGVSYERFLLHHTNCDSNTSMHFCMLLDIDPYIRKFVSPVGHSHHGYFIDPRPIGYTAHLWATFLSTALCHDAFQHLRFSVRAALSRLHRASDIYSFRFWYASRRIREGVSGRYPFIPPFGLPVLLKRERFFSFFY